METIAISKSNADLPGILAYKNENIISRFTDLFNISWEEAEDIFMETKKFLYISGEPGVTVGEDIAILDEMWHNFICFTKEYEEFGRKYFGGEFIHHSPSTRQEKEASKRLVAENQELAKEEYLQSLEILMNAAYDEFGEDTVTKWFQVYPVKYSIENIRSLRKK